MARSTNSIKAVPNNIVVVANYSALPDPATVPEKFYWASNSQGTSWLPGNLGGTFYNSGMYYSNGVSWEYLNVPYQATQAEVNAGVNDNKFVTANTFFNSTKWSLYQTVSGLAIAVLNVALTGLTASSGTFTSSDSVLTAFNKIKYLIDNIALIYATIASPTFTGTVTTPALIISGETASTLVYLNASKNLKSLPLSTYPSPAELAFVKNVTSSIQTQIDSKITENAVVDYSAASTIVGLSSFTTKKIEYLVQGKITHVWFDLAGVSNSASFSFTIPQIHSGANNYQSGGYSLNNSAALTTAPRIELVNGSNVINISRIMTGGTWTASGNKQASGYFVVINP